VEDDFGFFSGYNTGPSGSVTIGNIPSEVPGIGGIGGFDPSTLPDFGGFSNFNTAFDNYISSQAPILFKAYDTNLPPSDALTKLRNDIPAILAQQDQIKQLGEGLQSQSDKLQKDYKDYTSAYTDYQTKINNYNNFDAYAKSLGAQASNPMGVKYYPNSANGPVIVGPQVKSRGSYFPAWEIYKNGSTNTQGRWVATNYADVVREATTNVTKLADTYKTDYTTFENEVKDLKNKVNTYKTAVDDVKTKTGTITATPVTPTPEPPKVPGTDPTATDTTVTPTPPTPDPGIPTVIPPTTTPTPPITEPTVDPITVNPPPDVPPVVPPTVPPVTPPDIPVEPITVNPPPDIPPVEEPKKDEPVKEPPVVPPVVEPVTEPTKTTKDPFDVPIKFSLLPPETATQNRRLSTGLGIDTNVGSLLGAGLATRPDVSTTSEPYLLGSDDKKKKNVWNIESLRGALGI